MPNDDSDTQLWNEVQLSVPMSKHVDFVTQFQLRVRENISQFGENRLQFGFNFKPNKHWSVYPFYMYVSSRDWRGLFRVEHRYNLRVGYKFQIKKLDVTVRGLAERRERQPQNSWRFRPSVFVEKELPKKTKLKLFGGGEVFYDTIPDKFCRNRAMFGINRKLNKHLSVDLYFMRQNDGFTRQGNWNVFGSTWRIKI